MSPVGEGPRCCERVSPLPDLYWSVHLLVVRPQARVAHVLASWLTKEDAVSNKTRNSAQRAVPRDNSSGSSIRTSSASWEHGRVATAIPLNSEVCPHGNAGVATHTMQVDGWRVEHTCRDISTDIDRRAVFSHMLMIWPGGTLR